MPLLLIHKNLHPWGCAAFG